MKTKRYLAALLSIVLIGQTTPVFAEETKDFSTMEETTFTSDAFKEFAFVYELINVMNKQMRDECKGIDIRSYGDKLDLENPSQSKVDVIAGNKESAKELEEFVINHGYSKDILLITVNPDFVAEPDIPDYTTDFSTMEETTFTSDAFKEFAFVYELIDVMNKQMRDECKGIDIRSYGDKLDLENPSQSKVDVIAGNEESAKELEEFVINHGYSKDILLITVNPDFVAEPDIPDYISGDINADGKVDLTDLSELSLAIIGDKTLTESQIKVADIDKNGKADLPDLARLKQYLSKVITSL